MSIDRLYAVLAVAAVVMTVFFSAHNPVLRVRAIAGQRRARGVA
jgi:3-deoxy-D-arabino-heptulosonate 7-phosphate (DAHP) synthase class II